MPTNAIVDIESLVQDLRLVVAYAAKAGVLSESGLFMSIDAAEEALDDPHKRDVKPVAEALNNTVRAIWPMTLADLKFGRDPFLEANQRKARSLQFGLTIFTLVVLFIMGYFMQALKQEQEAVALIEQSQSLEPQQKLTALRKLAQLAKPSSAPYAIDEQYNQRKSELLQINAKVLNTYNTARSAQDLPLFPFSNFASEAIAQINSPPPSNLLPPGTDVAPADNQAKTPANEFCAVDDNGELKLPTASTGYSPWMQSALRETLMDFCFQVKVLSPGNGEAPGGGELAGPSASRFTYISPIRQKISLRINWFLPFLYGLLGSAVFMMRNVSSVRTPAIGWLPVVMRICLGGVAGIVIGWFASGESLNLQATNTLTLPFILAFLTGYGIDVLFTLLDRLNRMIGAVTSSSTSNSPPGAPPRSLAT